MYLADRVLPMLPERLCNDLCSLRPDGDRLAFTVDIELDAQGRVRTYEPYPSVIRSRVRMDYGAADALLREGEPGWRRTRRRGTWTPPSLPWKLLAPTAWTCAHFFATPTHWPCTP